jgi:hypothetical protein
MKRFAAFVYLAVTLASLAFAAVWVWDAATPIEPGWAWQR